jgi:hypothetical protein
MVDFVDETFLINCFVFCLHFFFKLLLFFRLSVSTLNHVDEDSHSDLEAEEYLNTFQINLLAVGFCVMSKK